MATAKQTRDATQSSEPLRIVRRGRAKQSGGHSRPGAVFLGVRKAILSDAYFVVLEASWSRVIAGIVVLYLLVNVLFAGVYVGVGGIQGARQGSFADAFFFSVQTMATIGYGAMHPVTPFANALVTAEALIGLLGVAMATGILFTKFARPVAKLVFSDVAVISVRDGVASLQFRVANIRGNHVMQAGLRVVLVRNEVTAEGESVRRWHDLDLVRSHSPIFAITWTAVHQITDESALHGETTASLRASEAEVIVTLAGTDSTLASTIHARHSYIADEILWGARFVDIIGRSDDGRRTIDFREFHNTVDAPWNGWESAAPNSPCADT